MFICLSDPQAVTGSKTQDVLSSITSLRLLNDLWSNKYLLLSNWAY